MVINTCRDLVRYIKNNGLEDCSVAVGCEGYSNIPDDWATEIRVDVTIDGRVMIHDNCYYDELEQ